MGMFKKVAVGAAAAALMASGSVAMAGVANAAPGGSLGGGGSSVGSVGPLGTIDTSSLGVGERAPGMQAERDEETKRVTVKMENPDSFLGVCTPVLVEASQAVTLAGDPAALLTGGTGITLFTPPIPFIQEDWKSIGTVPDGAYALVGVCAGLPAADNAIQLMVFPNTVPGSVEGVMDFGSAGAMAALNILGGS